MFRGRIESRSKSRIQSPVQTFGGAGNLSDRTLRRPLQLFAHLVPMGRQRTESLGADLGEPLMQCGSLSGKRGDRDMGRRIEPFVQGRGMLREQFRSIARRRRELFAHLLRIAGQCGKSVRDRARESLMHSIIMAGQLGSRCIYGRSETFMECRTVFFELVVESRLALTEQ